MLLKIKIKCQILYRIITGKYKHFVVFNVDEENHLKLLKGEDFDVDGKYYGIQHYCYLQMIKCLSNTIKDNDLICEKAHFEASAIEFRKSNREYNAKSDQLKDTYNMVLCVHY